MGKWLLPPSISTFAGDVDRLFYFITVVCLFFFVAIIAGTVYFLVKFRRKGDAGLTSPIDHNRKLEIIWTVIPSVILLLFFIFGFRLYLRMGIVPANSMVVNVTGQQWFWSFTYPSGATSVADLVVPVNQSVELRLSSKDVIHSFFVPAFRMKLDAVPNRYGILWFEANKIGEYPIYCAEYCGTNHSKMLGHVKVVSMGDYEKWLTENAGPANGVSLAEYGAQLYEKNACVTCHSIDGTPRVGPTFKGVFGRQEKLADGTTIKVDPTYIHESIVMPTAKIVAGFQPVMPSFQGLLKEKDIEAIIAFLETLK